VGDIFQEVDEEVRRDRFNKFWKGYGVYVIAAGVALVLGTAASVGWGEYNAQRQQQDSDRFAAAIALATAGKQDEATSAFRVLSTEAQDGYALFARFRTADAQKEAGDIGGAIQTFEEITADTSVDTLYRNLASLLTIMHTIDDGEPEQLRAGLMPLLAGDGVWRHSARELSGALALRVGDRELAKIEFQKLADDVLAPPGVRARATEILQILGS
jgi:hypothetical protein